jgi:hypothetical protein
MSEYIERSNINEVGNLVSCAVDSIDSKIQYHVVSVGGVVMFNEVYRFSHSVLKRVLV